MIASFWRVVFTKLLKARNGKICVLCHNFLTNWDTDPFSTSKWPSKSQFCERYLRRWQKKLLKLVVKWSFMSHKFCATVSTCLFISTPIFHVTEWQNGLRLLSDDPEVVCSNLTRSNRIFCYFSLYALPFKLLFPYLPKGIFPFPFKHR